MNLCQSNYPELRTLACLRTNYYNLGALSYQHISFWKIRYDIFRN